LSSQRGHRSECGRRDAEERQGVPAEGHAQFANPVRQSKNACSTIDQTRNATVGSSEPNGVLETMNTCGGKPVLNTTGTNAIAQPTVKNHARKAASGWLRIQAVILFRRGLPLGRDAEARATQQDSCVRGTVETQAHTAHCGRIERSFERGER
jgi:hypothetical protein